MRSLHFDSFKVRGGDSGLGFKVIGKVSDNYEYRRNCIPKNQPLLKKITVPVLSSELGLSQPNAAEIRAGRQVPHPRHWLTHARLVGVSPNSMQKR